MGYGGQLLRAIEGPAHPRLHKLQKLDFIDWLASSEGPDGAGDLKSIEPGTSTWVALWLRRLSLGRIESRERTRLFVPCSPLAKILALRRYGRDFSLRVLVETGTYLGDTTAALADDFERCFTVEFSPQLHARARARFAGKPKIECLLGNSADLLPEIVKRIATPALFWLDAHASGGETTNTCRNPILQELQTILSHRVHGHVVLIDDARGHDLVAIRHSLPSGFIMTVRNDVIRIVPSRFNT